MWRGPFLPFVSVHHPDTIKPIIKTVGKLSNLLHKNEFF
jgi:hypothetical protein